MTNLKPLTSEQTDTLLKTLKTRFEKNQVRHPQLKWDDVLKRLQTIPEKLSSLLEMEMSGGEPDVVTDGSSPTNYFFYDCCEETPKGRRSFCYDRQALDARKEFKPKNTAVDFAHDMGTELLTEEQYQYLQTLGVFDIKTSSWLKTPSEIRKLGGAIFADRRYDHVFIYHNGADSYYASRGFRVCLKV